MSESPKLREVAEPSRYVPRVSVRVQLTLWNIAVVAIALTMFGVGLRFGVQQILLRTIDNDLARKMDRAMHIRPEDHGPPGDGPHGIDGANLPPPGSFDGGDHRENQGQNRDGSEPNGGQNGMMPHWGNGPQQLGPPHGHDGDGFGPRLLQRQNGGKSPQGLPAYSAAGYAAALQNNRASYSDAESTDGQAIRVLSRLVTHPDGTSDVLQMAAPVGFVRVADRGVLETLLLLIPAALLLTGIGGAVLTNRALRPISQLGQMLGRIQAQNLKERIPGEGSDEFGRLTAVINAMLARLESAFERQRRFAADASHELRTPLATIRTSSSLALDPTAGAGFSTEQYRSILTRIDGAADRATRVTQDLLFLARVGSLPVRHEQLTLRSVLDEARTSVLTAAALPQPVSSSRGSRSADRSAPPEITLDIDPDLRVSSDRDHLLRLFINLIDNAARHTPTTGQVHIVAHTLGRAGSGETVIEIADTGEGIAAEHLERIQEPFYRPDGARSRHSGGAGLGLAIARGIADALGGTLQIESTVGQGTTVTLTLPGSDA
jgi:signal transduction histidine kinase